MKYITVEGIMVRGAYDELDICNIPEQDREFRGYDLDVDLDGYPEGFEPIFCYRLTECYDQDTNSDYLDDMKVFYFVRKGVLKH